MLVFAFFPVSFVIFSREHIAILMANVYADSVFGSSVARCVLSRCLLAGTAVFPLFQGDQFFNIFNKQCNAFSRYA